MTICVHCGAKETIPFTCKFCGGQFCANHHLPENHGCTGLEKFKEERGRKPEKWIYEPFHEGRKERVGREVKRPMGDRLSGIAGGIGGIDSRKILYLILVIIAVALLLELIGSL